MRRNQLFVGIMLALGILIITGCNTNTSVGGATKLKLNNEAFVGEVKEFNVVAYRWGFEPSVISVNKGDKVRITATSRDVPHGFAIDEYGINLYLDGLRPKTVEFIADKAGTFIFYCNVPCGSGHNSMRGKLIVK
jgi:nitrosocyanin